MWQRIEQRKPSTVAASAIRYPSGALGFTDRDEGCLGWMAEPEKFYPGTFEEWIAERLLQIYAAP